MPHDHASHHHHHPHAVQPPVSLLLLSAPVRLAGVAVLLAAVWAATFWALG